MSGHFTAQPAAKGDKFRVDNAFVEVTRCSLAHDWADIRVRTWAMQWTKRMPAGIPAAWQRSDWTDADVIGSNPYLDEEVTE